HPERNDGTRVSQDGSPELLVELGQVLMCQHQVQAVLSRRAENVRERQRGEIVKFVHIEIEGPAPSFGQVSAAHGGQLDVSDEHRAQQAAIIFPDFSLGQVGDEDLALVHDLAEVQGALSLPDDVAERNGGQELTDLVEDG